MAEQHQHDYSKAVWFMASILKYKCRLRGKVAPGNKG